MSASAVDFGEIVGVIADPEGAIFVADAQARQVVVLSPDGREIRRIGRAGRGPGEFVGIRSIAWKAGTLAVLDLANRRVSMFDIDGRLVSTLPWPSSAGRPHRLLTAGSHLIAAGTFPRSPTTPAQTAAEAADRFRQPEVRYFVVDGDEFRELAVRDTLSEPRGFDCDGPGGSIATFPDPLFGRVHPLRGFLTIEEFVIAVPEAARLDVVATSTGEVLRSIALDVPELAVSDAMWASATEEYRERERQDGPFDCDIDRMRPAILPRIRSVIVDSQGRTWVEARVGADDHAFLILAPAGDVIAVAPIPSRDYAVAPYVRDNRLYVVRRHQYDVAGVHTFRLDQPLRE